ncbi:type I glyceraldehyde-3-phosphate dehydrogenase [Bradyrhizobium sp. WSM 1738]|uniref:type I glyceraldehyde-3-phosphate dehydrogenase n=1 Tax=Bradyrhizobium hereditatis TaxID=2821405 RepID=UPI001CE2EA99|nr:glyceraldehyde 3-phosphate dehydrogenase NAD-binding domain-containing protein [Bradyrhizobium hereditatis]MCA6117354.1 type I glyceraldehyde-3-phosphate dehydrogenase [Bradyrhizobium hereditatis]
MKVAINGFGRIGRTLFKQLLEARGFDVVAVNDIASADDLAYSLKFDTVRGRYSRDVEVAGDRLVVDGRTSRIFGKRDPQQLPWGELGVELVFECTGRFTDAADLERHLAAGAGFVILSAPVRDGDVPTLAHGVNTAAGKQIVSCASCTTNAITPVMEILNRRVGVRKATMTTVHAYTAGQALVDGPLADRRRGRAAAANLVPSTTGAARATTKALPELAGRFDGVAIRAPVPVGSIADITCLVAAPTTVDAINAVFREEAVSERYHGVVGVSDDELVSSDVIGDPRAAIVDLTLTQVVDGDLVKLFSWYDNEWGYSAQLVRVAQDLAASRV